MKVWIIVNGPSILQLGVGLTILDQKIKHTFTLANTPESNATFELEVYVTKSVEILNRLTGLVKVIAECGEDLNNNMLRREKLVFIYRGRTGPNRGIARPYKQLLPGDVGEIIDEMTRTVDQDLPDSLRPFLELAETSQQRIALTQTWIRTQPEQALDWYLQRERKY